MERFKNELTHPFSRKYAHDVLDNHAYNSGLLIDNNYPDLEGYIDKNDSKSLQNLLEVHNKDILDMNLLSTLIFYKVNYYKTLLYEATLEFLNFHSCI